MRHYSYIRLPVYIIWFCLVVWLRLQLKPAGLCMPAFGQTCCLAHLRLTGHSRLHARMCVCVCGPSRVCAACVMWCSCCIHAQAACSVIRVLRRSVLIGYHVIIPRFMLLVLALADAWIVLSLCLLWYATEMRKHVVGVSALCIMLAAGASCTLVGTNTPLF